MLHLQISLGLLKKTNNQLPKPFTFSPGLTGDSLKLELPFLVGSHFFVYLHPTVFLSYRRNIKESNPCDPVRVSQLSLPQKPFQGMTAQKAGPPGEFSAKRNLLQLLPRPGRNLRRAGINLEVPKISRGCFGNRRNTGCQEFYPTKWEPELPDSSQNRLYQSKTMSKWGEFFWKSAFLPIQPDSWARTFRIILKLTSPHKEKIIIIWLLQGCMQGWLLDLLNPSPQTLTSFRWKLEKQQLFISSQSDPYSDPNPSLYLMLINTVS